MWLSMLLQKWALFDNTVTWYRNHMKTIYKKWHCETSTCLSFSITWHWIRKKQSKSWMNLRKWLGDQPKAITLSTFPSLKILPEPLRQEFCSLSYNLSLGIFMDPDALKLPLLHPFSIWLAPGHICPCTISSSHLHSLCKRLFLKTLLSKPRFSLHMPRPFALASMSF